MVGNPQDGGFRAGIVRGIPYSPNDGCVKVVFMRGQVGLEFFLILGFCLAMLSVLISSSERQINENEKLDATVLSLSALNSVSNAINTVALQGNGAYMSASAFVPQSTKCFLLTSENRLACDIGDKYGRRVYGMKLLQNPGTITADCYSNYGWIDVMVTSSAGEISVYCARQA
jgi:hypothetical protein